MQIFLYQVSYILTCTCNFPRRGRTVQQALNTEKTK